MERGLFVIPSWLKNIFKWGKKTMSQRTLYYATNRKHEGSDRWNPKGYGINFSNEGLENLRFGEITVNVNDTDIQPLLDKSVGPLGRGDGESLSEVFKKAAESAQIRAYEEDTKNPQALKLGSTDLFNAIKKRMANATDVLIYIHGFNVSWHDAVGSALALEEMLRNSPVRKTGEDVMVVLFSWPSDGQMIPWMSYKSDRSEASASGYAFARGVLKVRDFIIDMRRNREEFCNRNLHLLCHSMGNYVLQNTLSRLYEYTFGSSFPRIFENIFMCSPDVDDNVFENGQPMNMLPELASAVSIYYNREDKALKISDYTKANPERLGTNGASRPQSLHNKIHQIDCTPVVTKSFTEHSYYLIGNVCADIRKSIDEVAQDRERPWRQATHQANAWIMKKDNG